MIGLDIDLCTQSAPSRRLDVHCLEPQNAEVAFEHMPATAESTFFAATLVSLPAQQFCLYLQGVCVCQSSPPTDERGICQAMLCAIVELRQTTALPSIDVNGPPLASGSVLETFRPIGEALLQQRI